MTIEQIIKYGADYGTQLTAEEIKSFFKRHNGNPSAMELAIFAGAMDKEGNRLSKVDK